MGVPTQNVRFENVTATITYSQLNTISILNSSSADLEVSIPSNASSMFLGQGESVTISASSGFVLPDIFLDSSGSIDCQVILT